MNPSTGAQVGAAWVFTRTNGTWSQQGTKLIGSGAPGDAQQGTSVALSADGNTAIIGGPADDATTGAAWVFTRTNGVWSQQGTKLVGTGAIGLASQGQSVSLSADGNTAIVGGPTDNSNAGAAWIFTRSNGVWNQQFKLVGSSNCGSEQGYEVALSGDGSTAILANSYTSGFFYTPFACIFTNNGGLWTQQASLGPLDGNPVRLALSSNGNTALVGASAVAQAFTRSAGVWSSGTNLQRSGAQGQGISSVSLAADGNTAIIGGSPGDDNGVGAAWAFIYTGGTWSQLRSKFVGTGAVGASAQGVAALSADGNTVVVGGPGDNSGVGAVWIFVLSPAMVTLAHDFNGDGKSDLLWRNSNSFFVADWLMNGTIVQQSFGLAPVPSEWSIIGQRDFNGDGFVDLLWRDTSGNTAIWYMNNAGKLGASGVIGNIPTDWLVVGTGDFNGDGFGDILWRDGSGNLAVWLMNGVTVMSSAGIGGVPPSAWSVVGVGDFNGDGDSDILWRDASSNMAIWFMSGTQVASAAGIGNIPSTWSVVGTGDFNGDGTADILWRDSSGNTSIWLLNGASILSAGGLGNVPTTWSIVETGDYNGDGKSDLLWQDNQGNIAMWFMNGITIASTGGLGQIPTSWMVQSVNAE